jgi:hypothetical protein
VRNLQRSIRVEAERALLLAVLLTAPPSVLGAEPLDTIRQAFLASSQRLTSGVGKGVYRHYRQMSEGNWQLKQDADIAIRFNRINYQIYLNYKTDDLGHDNERRIIFDGNAIMAAWFTPNVHPTGSEAHVYPAINHPDGLSQPGIAMFPWDVARLSLNLWNPDRLFREVAAERLEIKQIVGGDLVGECPMARSDRVRIRFECPRRFGFNVARLQTSNVGQAEPAIDVHVEWKEGPDGLWYIRSLDTRRVLLKDGEVFMRIRDILKFTAFEPNAAVAPQMFTEAALQLFPGSRIIDQRPGVKERIRRLP